MFSRLVLSCVLLGVTALAHADTIVVPPGDVAALRQAIIDANEAPPGSDTRISLQGKYVFSPEDELPPISGDVDIGGLNPVFAAPEGGPRRLILVEEGGFLRLSGIEIRRFNPDSYDVPESIRGFIEVRGELSMHHVQFRSVYNGNSCVGPMGAICADPRPVLFAHESGRIDIGSVSFIDTGTTIVNAVGPGGLLENHGTVNFINSQLWLTDIPQGWVAPFVNAGELNVLNSSFLMLNAGADLPSPTQLLYTKGAAVTTFANSVIGGFSGAWCASATSLGHNLVDDGGCAWSAAGDLTGTPTGLIWRPVQSTWWFVTNALVPSAASAAVDSADPALCPEDSLTGRRFGRDGDGDGVAICDRGAMELERIGLGEGGINGFYYNPQDDGHYVYIQQTDFTTLVMWNTFDPDGNHVWVYGTGTLVNGRSVIADAYINRSNGFSAAGIVTDVEAEPWGRLEVDMESCTEGSIAYYSDLPEFGSGQFPVERLAYVKQLGCIDQ